MQKILLPNDVTQMAKKGKELQFEADHAKAALDESLKENLKVKHLHIYNRKGGRALKRYQQNVYLH